MGEKIKTLSAGSFLNSEFEIELNHPPLSGKDQQIHIQSNKFGNTSSTNLLVNHLTFIFLFIILTTISDSL
mgnify:CR=1 FL=1